MTVTGTPAALARGDGDAHAPGRGRESSAAPAPVLQTLRTGQPMLMSIRSAPASATIAGGRAHHVGVLAEELDRDGVLVGMEPQQLAQRALVAVVDAEARDHLRDREAGAVAARLEADEPVADPGERREQHAVGDLDVADPETGR